MDVYYVTKNLGKSTKDVQGKSVYRLISSFLTVVGDDGCRRAKRRTFRANAREREGAHAHYFLIATSLSCALLTRLQAGQKLERSTSFVELFYAKLLVF